MSDLIYTWRAESGDHELRLVTVPGTNGRPFRFGSIDHGREVEVRTFHIGATPVTQALWLHVMGSNPAAHIGPALPVENVTWDQITEPGGFLDRINSGNVLASLTSAEGHGRLRLPSESEWEYAARGGPYWTDGFVFSGSDSLDEVGWYGPRWSRSHSAVSRLLGGRRGWRWINRLRRWRPHRTSTHAVATKAPNQLGIFDMSGNVWEWCQDVCVDDLAAVPADGSPVEGSGDERRLRGGCHHNWDLHCTVSWRYGIARDAHDGCIGFRLVLASA